MRILFVCLGNICRSPLAAGIFKKLAADAGLAVEVASAGVSDDHVGQRPDRRARRVARTHGIELDGTARQVADEDFDRFDLLVAMDQDNYRRLLAQCPTGHRRKIMMLRAFENRRSPPDVPDPYYGGLDGFEGVYQIIEQNCRSLLEDIRDTL